MRRLPAKFDPTAISQSTKEISDPLIADHRNFYKVGKWTKDGTKVDHLLYAGSNVGKAREAFAEAIYHKPSIRLTIRQRAHVLKQWPIVRRSCASSAITPVLLTTCQREVQLRDS